MIVRGAAGPHVVSSRGMIGEVCSSSDLYQDKVYFGTLDTKVVAFDAEPSKVMWEKQVPDNADGYYFNHVPMIVKRKFVMGTKRSDGECLSG
jgi:outer membrane protein assembly factor BamB